MKLVQIFPEVCQQPQKWSLIENSWEAVGAQPLLFHAPELSHSVDGAQPQDPAKALAAPAAD